MAESPKTMGAGALPESSLRDLVFVLFRHKRKIAAFAGVATAATLLFTFLSPPAYRSEAKLLVRLGGASVTPDPTLVPERTLLPVRLTWESAINSEIEVLRSVELAYEVVDSLGPEAWGEAGAEAVARAEALPKPPKGKEEAPSSKGTTGGGFIGKIKGLLGSGDSSKVPDRDALAARLLRNLSVEALPDSNVISVAYEDRSPELAQRVVTTLVNCYLKKHFSIYRSPGSVQFLEEQTKLFEKQLAETEKALRDLKLKTGISSLEDDRKALLERVSSLIKQIDEVNASLATSQAKVESIRQLLKTVPETVVLTETTVPNRAADALRGKLYDLAAEEQKLLQQLSENSVRVKEIRRQIDQLKKLLKEEGDWKIQRSRGLNEAYVRLKIDLLNEQANLASLRARKQTLEQRLAEAQKALDALTTVEADIRRLERQRTIQEENYRTYYDNLQQAKIDKESESRNITNISVIQSATYNPKPVRPRKKLNLVLGLLFGLLGGLGTAFITEYLDHTFSRPEDLERRLAVPTLVSLPRLRKRKDLLPRVRKSFRKVSGEQDGSAFKPVVLKDPDRNEPLEFELSDALQDAFETLRTRITLALEKADRQGAAIVALTSSLQGEGTSTLAANLAVALANRSDGRVLYADLSGRRSAVEQVFPVSRPEAGPDVTINERTGKVSLQPLRAGNLDIICDLPRFEDSRQLSRILELLRSTYSLIVLDTPPVLAPESGVKWMRFTDQALLVVEAERTRWEVAAQARDLLGQVPVQLAGALLNKRRYHVPSWLYRTL